MPQRAPILCILTMLASYVPAQITPLPTFPARTDHGIAFDGTQARTILVGGDSSTLGVLDDTWERQAGPWQQVSTNAPTLSSFGIVSLPSLPGWPEVLLFGGVDNSSMVRGTTWQFSGNNWSTTGAVQEPSPRRDPLMAFDPTRNVVVLHGGIGAGNTVLNDTWEWDPVGQWVLISTTPPPGSTSRGMAFSPATGKITLVSGSLTLSIWEYSSPTWTSVTSSTFYLVSDYSVATDPMGRGVLIYGGLRLTTGSPTNRMGQWNGTSLSSVTQSGTLPEPRYGARLALDTMRGRLVVHGGIGEFSVGFSDTWEFDGQSWTAPSGASEPPFRENPGMVYVDSRSTMLLHGGNRIVPINGLMDTWERIGSSWFSVASGPAFSIFGASPMANDPIRDRVVMFNGTQTWEYDGTQWRLIPTAAAPASPGPMAYHRGARQCILFNGQTWAWNGAAWTQLGPASSPPSATRALAYDSRRGQIIAVAGTTWAWDGINWRQVGAAPPLPNPQTGIIHAMTYDERRDRVVAVASDTQQSGQGIQYWPLRILEWDGSQWFDQGLVAHPVQGGTTGPRPALAYDPQAGVSILFAGGETWELASVNPASASPLGQGCAGVRGIPGLARSSSGPWINNTFAMDITSNPGTNTGLGVLGFSSTAWLGRPLPFGLAGFGMPGCLLYTDLHSYEWLGGRQQWSFRIPNSQSFVGVVFYTQAMVFDPGSNPGGAVVTNALQCTIGRL